MLIREDHPITRHSVMHSTFSLERDYDVPTDLVFAAWADPKAKARWFAGPAAEHTLDFRVGGREWVRSSQGDGAALTFESIYHDIVNGARVVYSSTLSAGENPHDGVGDDRRVQSRRRRVSFAPHRIRCVPRWP